MMRRGEVWVARLNPNTGSEIGKIRPVVILQADELIKVGLPTIAVAPLTTRLRTELEPLRVTIQARDRLRRDSHVMPEQIRVLDHTRFGEGPLTILTRDEMAAVERSLRAVLGMY